MKSKILGHVLVGLVGAFVGVMFCLCWLPAGPHWCVMVPLSLPALLLAMAIGGDNPLMLLRSLLIPYWAIVGMVIALLLRRSNSRIDQKQEDSKTGRIRISEQFGMVGCIAGAIFLATISIVFLLSRACCIPIPIPGASDYTTKLPNGYRLMRQYSGSSLIFKPTEKGSWSPADQVGPSEYGIVMAVTGDYVVGNLDTEERAFEVPLVPDRYFIIDTSTDTVYRELAFEEYERKMRELGFERLPILIRPNKLTRFGN